MKRLFVVFLLMVLLVGCFSTLNVKADVAPTLNDGLVLYLPFDEGFGTIAYDSSVYANDGALINYPAWTTGKFGSGLNFSSTDQQEVSVNYKPQYIGGQELTVCCWANFSAFNGFIMGFYETGVGYCWYLAVDDTGHLYGYLYGVAHYIEVEWGDTINLNTLYFLVMRYNGTSGNIYVNAVNQYDNPLTGDIYVVGANPHLFVGSRGQDYVNAMIDDVRVYDRALTQEEINYLYEAPQPTPTPTPSATPTSTGNLPTENGFDWGGLVVLLFLVVGCLFVMGWFNRLWFFGVIFGLFAFVIGVYVSVSGVWSVSQVAGYFSMFEMFIAVITILVSALKLRVKR